MTDALHHIRQPFPGIEPEWMALELAKPVKGEEHQPPLLPLRACLKYFDKREGKADNKGKQVGDEGECVNIQAISGGKSMKRYERI